MRSGTTHTRELQISAFGCRRNLNQTQQNRWREMIGIYNCKYSFSSHAESTVRQLLCSDQTKVNTLSFVHVKSYTYVIHAKVFLQVWMKKNTRGGKLKLWIFSAPFTIQYYVGCGENGEGVYWKQLWVFRKWPWGKEGNTRSTMKYYKRSHSLWGYAKLRWAVVRSL